MARPSIVIFRLDDEVLEFSPTEFFERTTKRTDYRELTGGRRARVVSSDADSMRKTGRTDYEMTFEAVPQHFKDVLERARVFDMGPADRSPVVMRTNVGLAESDYRTDLVPNVAGVPSGSTARTDFYFPQRALVPGTVHVFYNGTEITPVGGYPYTVNHGEGKITFGSAISEGVSIQGQAERAASGYFEDFEARGRPGFYPARFDIRLTMREI